jgi:thiol-disulfide isomerase/thioredoxin
MRCDSIEVRNRLWKAVFVSGAYGAAMTDEDAGRRAEPGRSVGVDRRPRPVRVRTATELDRQVRGPGPVLVELFTEGCGICAAEEPVLSGVARSGEARVLVCNPRDDPALIERFDVRSVPTFLVFRDGQVVARRAAGFQSVADLEALLAGTGEG